jgi:hypothetical protein
MCSDTTRRLLQAHCATYPQLQIRDIWKFLYQSAFGCEHLLSSCAKVRERIEAEYASVPRDAAPLVEELDGDYCRVHLSCLNGGLSAETLGEWFCLSAKKEPCGMARLQQMLATAHDLVREGKLPFSEADFSAALASWAAEGYPAVRHSEAFGKAYRPAYRVVAREYAEKILL